MTSKLQRRGVGQGVLFVCVSMAMELFCRMREVVYEFPFVDRVYYFEACWRNIAFVVKREWTPWVEEDDMHAKTFVIGVPVLGMYWVNHHADLLTLCLAGVWFPSKQRRMRPALQMAWPSSRIQRCLYSHAWELQGTIKSQTRHQHDGLLLFVWSCGATIQGPVSRRAFFEWAQIDKRDISIRGARTLLKFVLAK